MSEAVNVAEEYLSARRSTSVDELLDFLRIPSISSVPEHEDDVRRAAGWAAERLRSAGLEHVEIFPTGGHPVVYGDWLHAPGRPTVLIYGHFDVQPVDPLELWESPPFEPQIRRGRIYARGACDMKANLLISVLGVEAVLRTRGALPVNVKFLLEGQEEIGSPQLPVFVAANRERLACDLVLSADGLQWSEDQPQLLIGLKGACGIQIDVRGAKSDLHSGLHGASVANPIYALVGILSSMRGPEGEVRVDGFHDDVRPLSEADRAAIAEVPFDEQAYKDSVGVIELVGEPGYSPLERSWARPTLDANGIWGGFEGEGMKTIVPNEAHAKITCRLVPDQDPDTVIEMLRAHVERNTPRGVTVEVQAAPGRAKPYFIAPDHWGNRVAAAVLTELYGRQPYLTRLGAGIPVCEIFLSGLRASTVIFGLALEDENFHAPNEFFRLSSFERGERAWPLLLERLGEHSA
jgi:acetylornithine deacetylase/succinyl-diaminopimelate desuccinylase-like protein